MKKLLLFLLTLFISASVFACCSSGGISCLTNTNKLSPNGQIVIVFYGHALKYIPALNKKYPVYLKAASGNVTLLPADSFLCDNLKQIVFKPAKKLRIGETYALTIDSLHKGDFLEKRFLQNGVWEHYNFLVTGLPDLTPPVFAAQPIEISQSTGKNNSAHAWNFAYSCRCKTDSTPIVLVTVTNKNSGKEQKFLKRVYKGTISIGGSICSSDFSLEANQEVTFRLMDHSGNLGKASKRLPVAITDDREGR